MDALMEPDFLAKSELFYSDMVGVSGSYTSGQSF